MASFKEALRRIYHEVVVGRSRVRVTTAQPVELDEPPIFLLGPYGSGTTLLRYVIDSHSRLCCPPESDFIEALAPLLEEPRYRQGLDSLGFDEEHVAHQLRQLCSHIFGNYMRSWGKARWADKTPAYIDHADLLVRLFPEAQFVTIHRHGLDQAHSYTRGGSFDRAPLQPFRRPDEDLRVACCRYWLDKTQRLLDFETRHGAKTFRLRYEDLCRQPESSLRPLFQFLNERWEADVLHFYEQSHDKGHEHGRVVATRGFQLSAGHYLHWSSELRKVCFEIASPGLEALGYEVL
jgi:hypothetical protein